jgi:hypothetical protein
MAFKRKTSHTKIYIGILLVVVLVVAATAAIIVATQPPAAKKAVVGVNVGDSFSYSIIGSSNLTALNAVDTPGFEQYNQTDYYKITVTAINGTSVTFDTVWQFKNGTGIPGTQTIDLSNGNKTESTGFWAIYSANLNVGDLLRPTGFDGLTVNQTNTRTFADSTRTTNFWFIDNQFFDVNDPTQSTQKYDYTGVFFDKQTGMLDTLTNYQEFNNPAMIEVVTWNLVNSTVWNVK